MKKEMFTWCVVGFHNVTNEYKRVKVSSNNRRDALVDGSQQMGSGFQANSAVRVQVQIPTTTL